MAGLCDWDWESEIERDDELDEELPTDLPTTEIDVPTWPGDSDEEQVPVPSEPVEIPAYVVIR